MCVAILTKPGKVVTNDALFQGWSINRDGGGLAFVADGQIQIRKGFLKYNEFQTAYEQAIADADDDSPMLIHMRIGTSGPNNEANTHPFEVTPRDGVPGAMIHNGVLFSPTGDLAGPATDRKSDTRVVAEQLGVLFRFEDVVNARDQLGRAIGTGNKFAFLYADKNYAIINEQQGYWIDDIWYSNTSCTRRINGSR